MFRISLYLQRKRCKIFSPTSNAEMPCSHIENSADSIRSFEQQKPKAVLWILIILRLLTYFNIHVVFRLGIIHPTPYIILFFFSELQFGLCLSGSPRNLMKFNCSQQWFNNIVLLFELGFYCVGCAQFSVLKAESCFSGSS